MATSYFEFANSPELECDEMARAASLAVLEERVGNHIKFFWGVVAFQFLCMGGLLWLNLQTKFAVGGIAQAQANAPAQIAAAILSKPAMNSEEVSQNLAAVSAVLQTSHPEKQRPVPAALQPISKELVDVQKEYPDLLQVWQTTGEFINYKSLAFLPKSQALYQRAGGIDCNTNGGSAAVNEGELTFSNCAIGLSNRLAGGPGLLKIVFINCVIDYEGGPVPSTPMSFYNCLFRFNVQIVPPPRGAQTMRLLAESPSIQSIQIPG